MGTNQTNKYLDKIGFHYCLPGVMINLIFWAITKNVGMAFVAMSYAFIGLTTSTMLGVSQN